MIVFVEKQVGHQAAMLREIVPVVSDVHKGFSRGIKVQGGKHF